MSAVQGQRVPGGFILITGQEGIRYALRPNQVAVVHGADDCQDETILPIYGGHIVRVPYSLEEVLGWFAWSPQTMANGTIHNPTAQG